MKHRKGDNLVDADDPFACFDASSSSSEDDDNDDDGNAGTNTSDDDDVDDDDNSNHDHEDEHDSLPVRDPGNGVLAFHAGTELALLHYVQTELELGLFTSKKKKKHDDGTSNKYMQVVQTSYSPPPPPPAIATAQLVLDRIDTFCTKRHWMMHIGPEKAKHIQAFIVKCLQSHGRKRNKNNKELSFVELGTYCGYSSIFIAKTILEYQYEQHQKEENEEDTHGEINDEMTAEEASSASSNNSRSSSSLLFHIYTVEIIKQFASVAKELIRLAGMDQYITIIVLNEDNNDDMAAASSSCSSSSQHTYPRQLSSVLRRYLVSNHDNDNNYDDNDITAPATLTNTSSHKNDKNGNDNNNNSSSSSSIIDFLFIDHDKSLYLSNLQELEQTKLVRRGTYVVADNVVFAQIDEYRTYMRQHQHNDNIVETRLEQESVFVEYCQPELVQAAVSAAATASQQQEQNQESAYLLDDNDNDNDNSKNNSTNNSTIRNAEANHNNSNSNTTITNNNNDHKKDTNIDKDMLRDGIEFTIYLQDPPTTTST